jgi:uncharacterized protein YndB with AHSA1/START domain
MKYTSGVENIELKINFKTAIKSAPEELWPLITTARGWDSWFTQGMVFNLQKNAEVLFSWKDWGADKVTETEKAVVLDFIPNKLLTFNWNFFLPEGPTTVELSITPRVDHSVVEVKQTGFHHSKAGLSMFTQCSAGWAEALTLLKFYVETGISYSKPASTE